MRSARIGFGEHRDCVEERESEKDVHAGAAAQRHREKHARQAFPPVLAAVSLRRQSEPQHRVAQQHGDYRSSFGNLQVAQTNAPSEKLPNFYEKANSAD